MKKSISILLVLCMLLSLIPAVSAEGEAVQVGSTSELQSAFAAGGYIVLADSFDLAALAEVPAGVTAVLDLNGKTITSTDGTNYYVHNAGTLTIVDSVGGGGISAPTATGTRAYCINNDGAITVSGGTYSVTATNGRPYALFSKGASVTVTGGSFSARYASTGSYGAYALGMGGTGSTAIIENGVFAASSNSTKTTTTVAPVIILTDSDVQITINGGSFTGTRTAVANGASAVSFGSNYSKLTINGGTFSASSGTDNLFNAMKGSVSITGGGFAYDGTIFPNKNAAVIGGTFVKTDGSKNDVSACVPDGYTQQYDGSVVQGTGETDPIAPYAAELISYFATYQDAAETDILRVLAQMQATDASAAAAWDKIMGSWRAMQADGFVKTVPVDGGAADLANVDATIPNDNSVCIVILGYKLNADGSMQSELVGRLQAGLALANRYPNAYVLVTGGGTAADNPNVTEAGQMAQWLLDNGLDSARLIVEAEAGSTVQNATKSYALLVNSYPIVNQLVMVTSDYHICRGTLLFCAESARKAQTTGREINVIANAGYVTGKSYETVQTQASSLCSLTGISSVSGLTLSELQSITVAQSGAYEGGALNLTVTASYDSGFIRPVAAQITGFDEAQGADQTVTVSYTENGRSATGEFALTQTNAVIPVGYIEGEENQQKTTELKNALAAGGSIVLTDSFTLTELVEVPAGVTAELDLAGKTITSEDGTSIYLHNLGNLTIIDSVGGGGINVTAIGSDSGYCVNNDGVITIVGGTFTAVSSTRSVYALFSKGKSVTITGGSFSAQYKSTGAYAAHTLALGGTGSSAVIENGTFAATSISSRTDTRVAPLYIPQGSDIQVTVNGGAFTGSRTVGTNGASAVRFGGSTANSKLTINGGTFRAVNSGADFMFNNIKGSVSITGGSFTYDGQIFSADTAKITGGKFVKTDGTKNDVSACVQSGCKQQGDGTVVASYFSTQTTQTGVQVSVDRAAMGVDDTAVFNVIIATYDAETKQMRAVKTRKLGAGESEFEAEVELAGAEVKVFLTDADFKPVSDTVALAGTASYAAPEITLTGPVGTIDIVADDFKAYLTQASAAYDNATPEELETMQSVQEDGQSVYTDFNANGLVFTWTVENPSAAMRANKFTVQLSQSPNFTSYKTIACESFDSATGAAQSEPIWNLMTDATYYWCVATTLPDGSVVTSNAASFTTLPGPRLLKIDKVDFERDFGGWMTASGKRVPQGRVYRSGGLEYASAAGIQVLTEDLGLRTEIDLRNPNATKPEAKPQSSLDPNVVQFINISGEQYEGFFADTATAAALLRVFADASNYPILFHCQLGADRTGSLAFFLHVLVGVSVADSLKDYEITKNRTIEYVVGDKSVSGMLRAFYALEGDTPQQKAINFCRSAGLSDAEINAIITNIMGEGLPSSEITLTGPVGSIDTVPADVRAYLADASAAYDNATLEQLLNMTSPKSTTESLYENFYQNGATVFTWTWDNRDVSVPAENFTVQLSLKRDFSAYKTIACASIDAATGKAQSEDVWNLYTGATYYWRVAATLPDGTVATSAVASFTTAAGPRLLKLDQNTDTGGNLISNARDFGGWETASGVRVPEGRVYRSGRLENASEDGVRTVMEELGIRTEIDLRNPNSSTDGEKAITSLDKTKVKYVAYAESGKQYGEFIDNPTNAKKYLLVFADANNYPILFHCKGGADRTGTLAFILGALVGVSQSDLIKDFELTKGRVIQYSNNTSTTTDRTFRKLLSSFNALEGNTPQEKAWTFCRSAGLSDAEIQAIITNIMG